MGQVTTRFINNIEDIRAECGNAASKFLVKMTIAKVTDQKIKNEEQIMTARQQAVSSQKGALRTGVKNAIVAATPDMENMDRDPQWKAAHDQCAALNGQFMDLVLEIDPLRNRLINRTAALGKLVGEFDAYVKKKESAWFGSKKSVPAAKESIASATTHLGHLREFLKLQAR